MAIATLSLLDCCTPIISYLSWLTEASREEEASAVKTRFEILFRELDQHAAALSYTQEEIRFVMFAVVAAIDERLMTHDWPGKRVWFREPLQLSFFDTNAAGEEFYLRLDQVRERVKERKLRADVLEVYHAMLCIGLQGQMGANLALRKQRDELITELGEELSTLRPRDKDLGRLHQHEHAGNIQLRRVWLPPLLIICALSVTFFALWLWLNTGSADAVSILEGSK